MEGNAQTHMLRELTFTPNTNNRVILREFGQNTHLTRSPAPPLKAATADYEQG